MSSADTQRGAPEGDPGVPDELAKLIPPEDRRARLADGVWRSVLAAAARPPGVVSIVVTSLAAAFAMWVSSFPGHHPRAMVFVVVAWLTVAALAAIKVGAAISFGDTSSRIVVAARWSIALAIPIATMFATSADVPLRLRLDRSVEAMDRALAVLAAGGDAPSAGRLGHLPAHSVFTRNGGLLFWVVPPWPLTPSRIAYMPRGVVPPDCSVNGVDTEPVAFSHIHRSWHDWWLPVCHTSSD